MLIFSCHLRPNSCHLRPTEKIDFIDERKDIDMVPIIVNYINIIANCIVFGQLEIVVW